jgi:valyl-tRNA synthetase
MAPLLPHITEEIYQTFYRDIDGTKSIHITSWPEPIFKDTAGEIRGELIRDFIRIIRHWKSEHGIPLNSALSYVGVIAGDKSKVVNNNKNDIINTIKSKSFEIIQNAELEVKAKAIKPVYSVIGPEFKGSSKEIINKLQQQTPELVLQKIDSDGCIEMGLSNGDQVKLTKDHIQIETTKQVHGREVETITLYGEVTILIEK